MSRARTRFAAFVLVALAIIATPTILIVARATGGRAGFGDAETVGQNRVSAATLDLAVGERTQPLRIDDLAPGDAMSGAVELVNAGTIGLRYSVTVSGSTSNGLGDWLDWTFAPAGGATCPTPATWRSDPPAGAVVVGGELLANGGELPLIGAATPGAHAGDRVLDVGERELLCLMAELSIDAPNTVQATRAELSLRVDAEQATPSATEPIAPAAVDGAR